MRCSEGGYAGNLEYGRSRIEDFLLDNQIFSQVLCLNSQVASYGSGKFTTS